MPATGLNASVADIVSVCIHMQWQSAGLHFLLIFFMKICQLVCSPLSSELSNIIVLHCEKSHISINNGAILIVSSTEDLVSKGSFVDKMFPLYFALFRDSKAQIKL